jgi:23S rRNA G2445 N2-methylase RlmL
LWQDVDRSHWKDLWQQAQQLDQRMVTRQSISMNGGIKPFYGNDIHPGAIQLAQQAAKQAKVDHLIQFSNVDIEDYQLPTTLHSSLPTITTTIITNPPWDKRLQTDGLAWQKLAGFLQQYQSISSENKSRPIAYVLTGNMDMVPYLAPLKPQASVDFNSADVDQHFLRFVL